jgi:division protein CdvB (Snf7/Vps24/ESCRT-III family)
VFDAGQQTNIGAEHPEEPEIHHKVQKPGRTAPEHDVRVLVVGSRLQSMCTMDQMSNVMNGMANIMGNAKTKINIEQFQNSMKTYTTEKERMQLVNEMIQDSMEMAED